MISIILVEPENSGNVGAVARVMANFGFKDLFLVNPKCQHLNDEARCRAKHAQRILENAKISKLNELKFDYLIGTSAVIGSDYNIPRSPITPEELARKVKRKANIALLFGREGSGLSNKEILKCDFIVKIPSSKKYGTLNVSHAAAIVLYSLFKDRGFGIPAATKKEKDVILEKLDEILDKLEFTTTQKKETQKRTWKRIIGKAMLTKREAFAVLGFLTKLRK
jgi:TrmH family RNA methyltransferase